MLFVVVIVVSSVGVICNDLLFPSSNVDLQYSIAFKTFCEGLGLAEIIEVFRAMAPTTSVSDEEFAL